LINKDKLIEALKILNETYVNIHTIEDKNKYKNIVWELLQLSYADLEGGYKGANSVEELIEKTSSWKLVKRSNRIVCGVLYKSKYGKKLVALFSDGTNAGKIELKKIIEDEIALKRSWIECSGKVELIYNRRGGVPIPNTIAKEILESMNKEIVSLSDDGFHYKRFIGGKLFEKIMFGNVQN
jgi:hypothetical protein